MTPLELGRLALAWLGTYAVHSSLLLGAIWAWSALRPFRSPRLRERIWEFGIVGGILTASLQLAIGVNPLLGGLRLAEKGNPIEEEIPIIEEERAEPRPTAVARARCETAPPCSPTATAIPHSLLTAEAGPPPVPLSVHSSVGSIIRPPGCAVLPLPAPLAREAASGPSCEATAPEGPCISESSCLSENPLRSKRRAEEGRFTGLLRLAKRSGILPWSPILSGLWLIAIVSTLGWFLTAWGRLSLRLRGRSELREGPMRERFERLRIQAGIRGKVRLTVSPAIPGPITLGIVRREICLPVRTLTTLSPRQQDAMLAHEFAHVLRRDALRFHGLALLEGVLFFQPLNRVARRQLHETAEILCDDIAVRWTGRRLALASCLAEIARWIVGAKRNSLPLPGMAEMRSRLGRRIERLLDDRRSPRPEGRHRWFPPLCLALGAVVIAAVPGVSAESSFLPSTDATTEASAEPIPIEPSSIEPVSPRFPLDEIRFDEFPLDRLAIDLPTLQSLLVDHRRLQAELTTLEVEMAMMREELEDLEFFDDLSDTFERFNQRVQSLHSRRKHVDRLVESLIHATPGPIHPDPESPIPGNDPRSNP
jgi:beta-lactamase regulating signal transducer with metallopeptidase domain